MLPTLWFRNTWRGAATGEGYWPRARGCARDGADASRPSTPTLGRYRCSTPIRRAAPPTLLFTENETNTERLFGAPNAHAAT